MVQPRWSTRCGPRANSPSCGVRSNALEVHCHGAELGTCVISWAARQSENQVLSRSICQAASCATVLDLPLTWTSSGTAEYRLSGTGTPKREGTPKFGKHYSQTPYIKPLPFPFDSHPIPRTGSCKGAT